MCMYIYTYMYVHLYNYSPLRTKPHFLPASALESSPRCSSGWLCSSSFPGSLIHSPDMNQNGSP